MVQRAVVRQVCKVCGGSCTSKLAMEEHLKDHGTNWPHRQEIEGDTVVMAHRAKDTMEFVGHLQQTPWGSELR
jgi:hypothetical protein